MSVEEAFNDAVKADEEEKDSKIRDQFDHIQSLE
jgi:hypothetical protein